MARTRTISPDFWSWENVIDCAPMTRLLFIGLWNFADDGGVQPLKPRTIRMQVFPGDTIENDSVRAMIDELAAQGLVRLYSVEGQDYVAIVDRDQLQRVGKRARRRYPAMASGVPGAGEAGDAPSRTITNHNNVETPRSPSFALRAPSPSGPSAAPDMCGETEKWRAAIEARLRQAWPHGPSIDAMEPADVLAAVSAPQAPPVGLHELAVAIDLNRARRLAALSQPPAERMLAAA